MWNYEKRLQHPVNITKPNAKIAQIIMSQYGGPDGEASAALRYLSQRYSMPYDEARGLLTDIGTKACNCNLKSKSNVCSFTKICPRGYEYTTNKNGKNPVSL